MTLTLPRVKWGVKSRQMVRNCGFNPPDCPFLIVERPDGMSKDDPISSTPRVANSSLSECSNKPIQVNKIDLRVKLNRKLIFRLPVGTVIISNALGRYRERLGVLETRGGAWQRAKESGAAGSLCMANWLPEDQAIGISRPGPMLVEEVRDRARKESEAVRRKISRDPQSQCLARPIRTKLTRELLDRLPTGA